MSTFGFDVANTKPQAAFDPLPPGWYAMRIIKAELHESQKAGQMLKIEFEVIEHAHPDYANRKAFSNFCHQHDNKQTRDIARAQIAAICHSIGRPTATSPDDMLGGELFVKLGVRPAREENGKNYDASNETKGFKGLNEVAPAGTAPAATASATTAKPAAAPSQAPKSQPWKR